MQNIVQIAGWIGTFLIVLAYYLVSSKRLDGTSSKYQLLNIFGAIGVGVNVLYQEAWPAVALQAVWIVIGITSIIKK